MARKGRKKRKGGLALDAYLTYAIFAALGVATWKLDQIHRLTLLWLTLLAFAAAYGSDRKIELSYRFSHISRGAVVGLVVSLPVAVLARDFLLVTSQRLFPVHTVSALVWGLVLVMAPVEAVYFRGLLQAEKGLWTGVLLYAAAGAIYFLPSTLGEYLPVLAALVAGMALLGFVYGYVRTLYGLAASVACQAVAHSVLFVLPVLSGELAGIPV